LFCFNAMEGGCLMVSSCVTVHVRSIGVGTTSYRNVEFTRVRNFRGSSFISVRGGTNAWGGRSSPTFHAAFPRMHPVKESVIIAQMSVKQHVYVVADYFMCIGSQACAWKSHSHCNCIFRMCAELVLTVLHVSLISSGRRLSNMVYKF
jgi:hypothetical protein